MNMNLKESFIEDPTSPNCSSKNKTLLEEKEAEIRKRVAGVVESLKSNEIN